MKEFENYPMHGFENEPMPCYDNYSMGQYPEKEMENCYMPYMQMMNMPAKYYPMATAPQEDLESMYPKIYYRLYPKVKYICDQKMMQYGMEYTPTRDELEDMADEVCRNVNIDDMETDEDEMTSRQFFRPRRFLRDLAIILLIRRLLSRRRPHFGGGFPGGGFTGGVFPGGGFTGGVFPGGGFPGGI